VLTKKSGSLPSPRPKAHDAPRLMSRVILGLGLVVAGVGHLSFLGNEFHAQVPLWLPLDADFVVIASGIVEIFLGLGLLSFSSLVPWVGLATATFFVAIFPGNIHQYLEGIDAFGLATDGARFARLFFQPVLVLWAVWSTQAVAVLTGESRPRSGPG